MSELEDRLNAVLNDPAELERIANMARSIMGNIAPEESAAPAGDMMNVAAKLAGMMKGGDRDGLVRGLSPYLSEKRRKRLTRALSLASAASVAETLFSEELGGRSEE